jgi:hypothetical protein
LFGYQDFIAFGGKWQRSRAGKYRVQYNSGKLTSNHELRRRRPWHLGRWISTGKVDEKSGREDIYNKFYLIYVCEF